MGVGGIPGGWGNTESLGLEGSKSALQQLKRVCDFELSEAAPVLEVYPSQNIKVLVT